MSSGHETTPDRCGQVFKFTIEYEGTAYRGWQRQANGPSIQAAVEEAVASVVGHEVDVHGASRTDTGVHALGQTAHARLRTGLPAEELQRAFNARLPDDIAVRGLEPVPDGFHARFDAVAKTYRYAIWRERTESVRHRRYAWHWYGPLDVPAMWKAGTYLVGRHDFTSLQTESSQGPEATRTIHRLEVSEELPFLNLWVEADGFLYHMVRGIVGTLVEVGRGMRDPASIQGMLDARDRRKAGPNAPARGLTLMEVRYR